MTMLFDMNDVIDTVIHGDALEELRKLPDCSIDAVCVDPPSSIGFMGKTWDSDKGGRTQWVAWLSEIMKEVMRTMKNGAHALVWSLPRTSHWTALALEDAGFQIRDNIYNIVSGDTALYNFIASLSEEQQNAFVQITDQQREASGILNVFGSGFPKSLDISKAIDRMKNMQREIIGEGPYSSRKPHQYNGGTSLHISQYDPRIGHPITAPATPESEAWSGWGSSLKPSVENWWLVRKPLAASNIAENVLTYGVGALNIDATRIDNPGAHGSDGRTAMDGWDSHGSSHLASLGAQRTPRNPQGRFPSHLLLSHTVFCIQSGTKRVRGTAPKGEPSTGHPRPEGGSSPIYTPQVDRNDEDGMETVAAWQCPEWCPVRVLDLQSGQRPNGYRSNPSTKQDQHQNDVYGKYQDTYIVGERGYKDTGGASRYFQQLPALDDVPPYIYAGKASRKDRTADNTVHNTHPTVKNISLLRYFVRLLTPENGIVLDCFAGSGSTGVACIHEGFHYILIEREAEYVAIAQKRIEHALSTVGTQQSSPSRKDQQKKHNDQQQPSLFNT